jgi:PKD repeat protein
MAMAFMACSTDSPTAPQQQPGGPSIVLPSPPVTAAFSFVANEDNLTVTFNNESSGASAFVWDFGDGKTSSRVSPVHTYKDTGSYTITLRASNSNWTDSDTQFLSLGFVDLVADFTTLNSNDNRSFLFQDTSTGNPTKWRWDFGDGNSSKEQFPNHLYKKDGDYVVCLDVSRPDGQKDRTCQGLEVRTEEDNPLQADFTFNNTARVYQFLDSSQGNPTSFSWSFGDGGGSSAQHPSHTYDSGGHYVVTLTIFLDDFSDSVSKIITVDGDGELSASFSFLSNGLQLQFQDQSTGDPTSWSWTFGDGGSSAAQHPVHLFPAAGQYLVELTVTNAVDSDTVNQLITVGTVGTLNASFTFVVDAFDPLLLTFQDTSSGSPTTWAWDFDDPACTVPANPACETSSLQNPSHTFSGPGDYVIELIVTNATDNDSVTQLITVSIDAVVASFTFLVDPSDGLTLDFQDTSTGNPTTWAWDFGGDGVSAAQNPSHTFSGPGNYVVELTASNSTSSDVVSQQITVTIDPVVASFTFLPDPSDGLMINFQDTSTGDPDTWAWDFGDGNTDTAQHPTNTYAAPGNYVVTLTATNSGNGNSDTVNQQIVVSDTSTPVVASFSFAGGGLTIQFQDTSTGDPDTWAWDFDGGGTDSTDQHPEFTFATAGDYVVQLTATNSGNGNSDSVSQLLSVPTIFISSVTPNSGDEDGEADVVIAGAGFATPLQVSFGGLAGTGIGPVTDSSITVDAPDYTPNMSTGVCDVLPGGSTGVARVDTVVDVTVTLGDGSSDTLAGAFTYEADPIGADNPCVGDTAGMSISFLSPISGTEANPPGTLVTITGVGFTGATAAVDFGGVAGTGGTVVNPTTITVTSPDYTSNMNTGFCNVILTPAGGLARVDTLVNVAVTLTNGDSDTLTGGFTFLAPPPTDPTLPPAPGDNPCLGDT